MDATVQIYSGSSSASILSSCWIKDVLWPVVVMVINASLWSAWWLNPVSKTQSRFKCTRTYISKLPFYLRCSKVIFYLAWILLIVFMGNVSFLKQLCFKRIMIRMLRFYYLHRLKRCVGLRGSVLKKSYLENFLGPSWPLLFWGHTFKVQRPPRLNCRQYFVDFIFIASYY